MDKARIGVVLTAIGLSMSGTVYAEPLTLTGGSVVLFDEGSFFRFEASGVGLPTTGQRWKTFHVPFELTGSLRAEQGGATIWSSDIVGKGIASSTFQLVNGGRWYQVDASPSTFITYDINPATAAPVPEPATMVLIGIGLLGIAKIARRRPHKTKS